MTFVARAVRQQGQALQFASEQLRRDPGLVRLAAEADFLALKFADPVLLADKHFMRRGIFRRNVEKRGGWDRKPSMLGGLSGFFHTFPCSFLGWMAPPPARSQGWVQRVATRREILQSRHGCHALQFAAPALQRDKELQALQRAGAKHWQHSTMPLPDQKKGDAHRCRFGCCHMECLQC